jgi:hypothetical protein
MTPELAKYYEERFSTMSTQGWVDFIEDMQGLKDVYEDITKINSVEDLYFKRGQLDILHLILNLKQMSETAYESLLNEEIV